MSSQNIAQAADELRRALEHARGLAKEFLTNPTDDHVVTLASVMVQAVGTDNAHHEIAYALETGLEQIARSICNTEGSSLGDDIAGGLSLLAPSLDGISTRLDGLANATAYARR